jgi:hypothetical protein
MNKASITKNQMKNNETFTKNYDSITRCKKLSSTDKLIIARILSWQAVGKICTESNDTFADNIGLPISTLSKHITKLNKSTFFKTSETSKYNEYDKWTNSKEWVINEDALYCFIGKNQQEPEVVVEPVAENKTYTPTEREEIKVEVPTPVATPSESNTSDLNNNNKERIVDVVDELNVEIFIVPDYDQNTHIITPPTPEELEAIKDFVITEKSAPRTLEQNYIEEILSLFNDNKEKIKQLGQSDNLKLEQIFNRGTAKKFDVTIFKNIFAKL